MTDYPKGLPCPQISDYQVIVDHAYSSVTFEHGNRRQRVGVKQERTIFSLSLVLTTEQLWTWQVWANHYGYDWHWTSLESQYSGYTGTALSRHFIRYISDISIDPVDVGWFRASFQAELDLDTTPQGTIDFTGNWYIARTPANPAPDVLIAGTPAAPSTNVIIAGTPGFPAA